MSWHVITDIYSSWLSIKVLGVAVLCWIIRVMFRQRRNWPRVAEPGVSLQAKVKRDKNIASELASSRSGSNWSCMGDIERLPDVDYRTVQPKRIYKFSPKYFLTMGLRKTSVNEVCQLDKQYAERTQARKSIVAQNPSALHCLNSAVDLMNELYEFLFQHLLPTRYPTVFQLHAATQTIKNTITDESIPCHPPPDRSQVLNIINRNVDEDFLMMLPSPDGDGYSLQAFVWDYPVGFTAQSKLGLKLREAHAPIPGYNEKLSMSMDRYFANVKPGDIRSRVSWAVASNDDLCVTGEYHFYEGQEVSKEDDFDVEKAFIRCEQQTLFALPRSGGRVLAVHLYLYPLSEIKEVGLGEEMIQAIDGLKSGNVPGFWNYKRVPLWGDKVKEYLRS